MTNKKYDPLLVEISKTGNPTIADIEQIQKSFLSISVTRNSVLEEQDKIPQYLYFINSGFMRLFFMTRMKKSKPHFYVLNLVS